MPFTPAHPAAVLPLARFGLPMSALVIGSVAPDLPYFLVPTTFNTYGHTLPGLFLFCLPAGMIALWLLHHLVVPQVSGLLPEAHQARLLPILPPLRGTVRELLPLVIALLIGAISHIVWDAFTHDDGWMVLQVPFLETTIFQIAHKTLPLYRMLQYLSTVFGFAAIVAWYVVWYRRAPSGPIPEAYRLPSGLKTAFRAGIASVSLLVPVLFQFLKPTLLPMPYRVSKEQILVDTIVIAISTTIAQCVLLSLLRRIGLIDRRKAKPV